MKKRNHSHTAGSPGANKGTPLYPSPYHKLKVAGCTLDHHESDLYVKATEKARRILHASGWGYEMFRSAKTPAGELWLEVPFAYSPWWEKHTR